MPSANLGLSNKVKKSYQGIDLDKKREEAVEDIGHSYVQSISWLSFIEKLLTFCDEHDIKILKNHEDPESGCLKFHSRLADVLPQSITFFIVSKAEEPKIAQRYDYYASNSRLFTKQNNKTSKNCYLFINKITKEVNGEKREGLTVYIQYSVLKPDGFNSTSLKGVVLSNSPVIDIEATLKSGYATRGGNLNTPPSSIGWLLCENTVKDLFDLISELKLISTKAEEKYRTTRLAEASVFNLITKNLSDRFKPVVINGRHELKYKYWDTLIESSTALGLSKKVSKEYSNRGSSTVIKEVIKEAVLDEKTFIKYVKDFIKKWQKENNTSAIPKTEDFVHPVSRHNDGFFAKKNNASCYLFKTRNGGKYPKGIVIYIGQKRSEHSGKFALYVDAGAWCRIYKTAASRKISEFDPAWLDMTVENFEHVFNWIQTKAPDDDDSLIESSTALGLSKKVSSSYSSRSSSSVVKEMISDKETFMKYVKDFIEKWQEENNASAIPQIKDFVHFRPDLTTNFAKKNNVSCCVFTTDACNISCSIIIYTGKEGTEHSGKFSLYVSSGAWGGYYRTTSSTRSKGFYPAWLDMTIENFEHVFNWIQTKAPDADDSMNESMTSSLGLAKKVNKHYQEKNIEDTIEDISVLDKPEFFKMCEKIFSPANSEYIVDTKKGVYDSKNDWDFWYVHRKGNDERPKTAYIRVDGTKQGYMFTFYMSSPFSGGDIEYPIGRLNTSKEICYDMVDENVPDSEIWDCLRAMQHIDMTVENLLKAKDFFEKCCSGEILSGWVNKEYVESYIKKWFSLKESNISLGLSNKVKKEYSKKGSNEAVIELSEMSFMEFYNALKNRLEVLGRAWQRDTKGKTEMNWWPKDFVDPDTRDVSRGSQWISMAFESVGRFTFKMYSQYQIYPKYKNLAEDTFKASYTYTVQPSKYSYDVRDIIFLTGDHPIQDPDASSFPFFKMTYGNLDKVIQWVSSEIRKPRKSTDLKRLVQMS